MKEPNTWGDIFRKWCRKGYDSAYAAWMADNWEKRRNAKETK